MNDKAFVAAADALADANEQLGDAIDCTIVLPEWRAADKALTAYWAARGDRMTDEEKHKEKVLAATWENTVAEPATVTKGDLFRALQDSNEELKEVREECDAMRNELKERRAFD